MMRKKLIMLGSFAVGKTSLVRRFVHSIYADRYLTTLGVVVKKKVVEIDGREVTLVIWDVHGEDELQKVKASYLRGSSGFFVVLDGTRRETLEVGEELWSWARGILGSGVPGVILLNKRDLETGWVVDDAARSRLLELSPDVLETSAKSGAGVSEAFDLLTRRMLEANA